MNESGTLWWNESVALPFTVSLIFPVELNASFSTVYERVCIAVVWPGHGFNWGCCPVTLHMCEIVRVYVQVSVPAVAC